MYVKFLCYASELAPPPSVFFALFAGFIGMPKLFRDADFEENGPQSLG